MNSQEKEPNIETKELEKHIDVKNGQRISYLLEHISSNTNISFTLLGFCLTSLIFLFSILPLYSIDLFSIYFTYIILMIGLSFLFLNSIALLRSKNKFIKILYNDEIKKLQLNKKIEHFRKVAEIYTYITFIGIGCFFMGVTQVLAAIFEEGWNLWIYFNFIIFIFVGIILKRVMSNE